MYNKLGPNITLPYSKIRGSFAKRQQMAIDLVDKFYRDLSVKIDKKGELKINDIQKSVDDVFEKKIKVVVSNFQDDPLFDGGSNIIYSPIDNHISGVTLEINSIDKKVQDRDIITLIHEFQHIADQACIPKYLSRNQHMSINRRFTPKYLDLYDNYIYCREYPESKVERKNIIKNLEHRILKFLRGKSPAEKLDYIQDTRYTMQMERQAYLTQRKYAKKLDKKHKPINCWDLDDEIKNHMLDEKINLLEKIGFDIIKKTRGRHAAKLKKQNLRNVKTNVNN